MLTPTSLPPSFDDTHKAIGFWMRDSDGRPVRVFVTCEGLWAFAPSQVRDLQTAFEQFESRRGHIEQVASTKYAENGPDEGEHEGQPIVILRGDDVGA